MSKGDLAIGLRNRRVSGHDWPRRVTWAAPARRHEATRRVRSRPMCRSHRGADRRLRRLRASSVALSKATITECVTEGGNRPGAASTRRAPKCVWSLAKMCATDPDSRANNTIIVFFIVRFPVARSSRRIDDGRGRYLRCRWHLRGGWRRLLVQIGLSVIHRNPRANRISSARFRSASAFSASPSS